MEQPGFGYLYTLATISITYSGFAVLVTVFRQLIGGTLSGFDIFFIRSVLMRSFLLAVFALFPPLLAWFELSPSTIWRISSVVAAVAQGLFILTYPARRRALTSKPLPRSTLANNIFQVFAAALLLVNASGLLFKPTGGLFAAALTAFLISAFISYMIALGLLLQTHAKKSD